MEEAVRKLTKNPKVWGRFQLFPDVSIVFTLNPEVQLVF